MNDLIIHLLLFAQFPGICDILYRIVYIPCKFTQLHIIPNMQRNFFSSAIKLAGKYPIISANIDKNECELAGWHIIFTIFGVGKA